MALLFMQKGKYFWESTIHPISTFHYDDKFGLLKQSILDM